MGPCNIALPPDGAQHLLDALTMNPAAGGQSHGTVGGPVFMAAAAQFALGLSACKEEHEANGFRECLVTLRSVLRLPLEPQIIKPIAFWSLRLL